VPVALALSWKWEDESDEGQAIGPVWLCERQDGEERFVEDLGWMTEAQAKALAAERGYAFFEG
jgi:hypothetical protein